jgi:hypothetical protein
MQGEVILILGEDGIALAFELSSEFRDKRRVVELVRRSVEGVARPFSQFIMSLVSGCPLAARVAHE